MMHGTERWMKEMLESNKKLTRYKKKQTRQKKILELITGTTMLIHQLELLHFELLSSISVS
jgi:hypothetical protein